MLSIVALNGIIPLSVGRGILLIEMVDVILISTTDVSPSVPVGRGILIKGIINSSKWSPWTFSNL